MAAQNEILRTIDGTPVVLVYDAADPRTAVDVYTDHCTAKLRRDPEAPCIGSRTRDCGHCKLAGSDAKTIQNRMAALEMRVSTSADELGDRMLVADAGESDFSRQHKIEVKWRADPGTVSVISYNQ
jgi:hypothetical protein